MGNRLLTLKQDKTAALDAANAILAKLETEKRSAMTAEERTEFDALHQKASDIAATIVAYEKQATATGNIPNDGPRTGIVSDVTDNAAKRPFGPEQAANETKLQRHRRLELGFGEYLNAVRKSTTARTSGGEMDVRLLELNKAYEKRAAVAGSSESVPSDGGFLVYPDFANEILMLAHETGLIHPRTRKLPLSEFTNSIKIPAVDEQSRKDGYRWGGVQMFWENEAQQLTGSKPTISLVEMVTKKLTGLYYATDEILADSRLLGAVVMKAFSEEMGFKLDDGVIRGTGNGQLLGILNCPALITVNKEAGQAASTIVAANIQKMWGRLWNRSRPNAVWLINQDIEQQLNTLNVQGANGGIIPIYLPPGASVFGGLAGNPLAGGATDLGTGGSSGTLLGRPVIAVEQASTLGTVGDIMLVDLDQFLMMDKGDMQTATSVHVRFLTDEQTFRWIYRVDGQPWWKTVLQPAQGSTTLSPFIALQAR